MKYDSSVLLRFSCWFCVTLVAFVQTGISTEYCKKRKGSPYSITECSVPELIAVLGSQPAGDASHKPSSTLPLLSTRPAVTLAILRGLLSILLLGEQRHDGSEQLA